MAEIERRKVNEVQDQDDFGPVEVRSDKEHDKGEVEEVVEDEVASNTGGSMNNVRVAREEVANVASLEEEEDNPGEVSASNKQTMAKRTSRWR